MTDASNNVIANVPGNLDQGQQQIIVNALQNAMASGGTFHLQPDGSAGSAAMAQSIVQQAGVSGNGVQILPATGSDPQQASIDRATAKYAPRVGKGGLDIPFNLGEWLQANAANWGLIVLGIVLGVGALLISQKETIIQIGKTTAKAAALIGE